MTPSADRTDSPGYEIQNIQADASVITAEIIVRSGSLWFDGHFPDNPILPGIAQMEMVFEVMRRTIGPDLKLEGFKRFRFKQLIRPDTLISVMIKPIVTIRGRYEYRLIAAQEIVCTGLIDICINVAEVTSRI